MSSDYWEKRESEALQHYIKEEAEYGRQINQIYQNMLDSCQKEIDAFYGKYAKSENITIAEAKKRVSKLDIEAYERKAQKYVANREFSKQANEEMRLYNATMRINRLEMLKANIGLELISGHDELEKFMGEILKGRTQEELKRQAGILGKTIKNNSELANAIPNASFHNATFSDRIWMYQSLMKSELSQLLQSGLIQGKNPRVLAKELKQKFNVSTYNAERLMRTELARVQTEAQKQSFERNGFDQYTFIVNSGCCDICQGLSGKHFKVNKMMPGENAPPMHPNCRCSVAAYEDSEEYEAWLDFLDNGGSTEEWNDLKNNIENGSSYKKKPLNKGVFKTFNATKSDSIRPDSIIKELKKSEIGKSALEYIEKENVQVNLCYGVDNPKGRSGVYDPIDDEITIYCDITKTVLESSLTVIHEATHRKLGCKLLKSEEIECFKNEVLHINGKLTDADINAIIKHVNEYYPELK